MARRMHGGIVVLAGILALLSLRPDPVSAQDRRSSGRHRPEARTVPQEKAKEAAPLRPEVERGWILSWQAGALQGGDLFRVATLDDVGLDWRSLDRGGFHASRFTGTLDANFRFGLGLVRQMGPSWALRADFSYCRQDLAAEALTGQVGSAFLYDRLSTRILGLGAELALAPVRSTPYLALGVALLQIDASWADLDQTSLGGYAGVGYRQALGDDGFAMDLEIRLLRGGSDIEGFRPVTLSGTTPAVDLDAQDGLAYFEFRAGLRKKL